MVADLWLALVLNALAAHRLTRLVVADTITERPRTALARRADWLDSLLSCPWCAGFWISGLVVAGWVGATALDWLAAWTVLTAVLAISSVIGLLSELES